MRRFRFWAAHSKSSSAHIVCGTNLVIVHAPPHLATCLAPDCSRVQSLITTGLDSKTGSPPFGWKMSASEPFAHGALTSQAAAGTGIAALAAAGLEPETSPFAAYGRPLEPAGAAAKNLAKTWAKLGIDKPRSSREIAKTLGVASPNEPEGAVANRLAPVTYVVAAELAASALYASGAPLSAYDEAAASETTADVVTSVVSNKSVLEAIGVAAATGHLVRTLSRRVTVQVSSRRANASLSQAQAQIEVDAEQLALMAERAGKRRRDRMTLNTVRPISAAHAKPVPDAVVDELVKAVPPAVAARFLAKRARMLADAAMIPTSHAASSNMSSAFALWATTELERIAKPANELGMTGATSAGVPLTEADVGPALLVRWHSLSDEERSQWRARSITLAATAALMPAKAEDLEKADELHAAAKRAITGAPTPGTSSASSLAPSAALGAANAAASEAVSTLEQVMTPDALAKLFDEPTRAAIDAAMREDTAAGTAINGQPRVDDMPSVPPRPFHHFVRYCRQRVLPASTGHWTHAEYVGHMKEVWRDPARIKETANARGTFSRATQGRNDRLRVWVGMTDPTHRQALRDATVANFVTVGAEPPAELLQEPAAPDSAPEGAPGMSVPSTAPKPPMTPFMAFAVAVRRRRRGLEGSDLGAAVDVAELSATDPEELEALGTQWRMLAARDRAVFAEVAARDRVRFASQQRLWEATSAISALESYLSKSKAKAK